MCLLLRLIVVNISPQSIIGRAQFPARILVREVATEFTLIYINYNLLGE